MMRGVQGGMAIGDAYKAKVNAQMQSSAIEMQMQEIDARSNIAVHEINKQGERVKAAQEGAYIKAGVEMEGSAMEVVSDTLADAAEAAMISKRQADYDMIGLAMQQAAADSQASDLNFLLNSAAGAGSAYAAYQGDKYSSNKGSTRNNSLGRTGSAGNRFDSGANSGRARGVA